MNDSNENTAKVLNLKDLSGAMKKRTTFERDFDFGGDIGVQKIYIGSISFALRQKIFSSRRIVKDGEVDQALAQDLTAELVAEALCDENGKSSLTVKDVRDWQNPAIVDRLSTVIMEAIPLGLNIDPNAGDPSKATN